jgi:hypothetical protein
MNGYEEAVGYGQGKANHVDDVPCEQDLILLIPLLY